MGMDGVDLLRIGNGKITEMWLFSADPAAEDAFWGSDARGRGLTRVRWFALLVDEDRLL
ncbi:hypothetical protein P1P75_03135 [Streptomyces sp. ID05-39B]|uniref:hypothetical protein n=1 Tax=Streptomyces sp. ID05-39B TaxID=3028664 RepID=UPI0029AC6AA2|nr:hypothetical protein [Streptomyces sp. ID05-39B]MDX3525451.1 hypothetical protein [Streptomyces sp. ID05-39B]